MNETKAIIVKEASHVIGLRPVFPAIHLRSAALLARRAEAVEQELLHETEEVPTAKVGETHGLARISERDDRYDTHLAFVIGSVLASVAAMDAAVNDTYISAYEAYLASESARQEARAHGQVVITSLTPLQEALAKLWQPNGDKPSASIAKGSVTEKAYAALKAAQKPVNHLKYRNDIDDLIDLRNLPLHFFAGTTWLNSDRGRADSATAALENSFAEKRASRGRKAIQLCALAWGQPFPISHMRGR